MALQEGSPKEVCDLYLEALYEAQQGKEDNIVPEPVNLSVSSSFTDQRLQYINCSNLRNDLKIFTFDPTATSLEKWVLKSMMYIS